MSQDPTWGGPSRAAWPLVLSRSLVGLGRVCVANGLRCARHGRRSKGRLLHVRRDGGDARGGAGRRRTPSTTTALLFGVTPARPPVRWLRIFIFAEAKSDDVDALPGRSRPPGPNAISGPGADPRRLGLPRHGGAQAAPLGPPPWRSTSPARSSLRRAAASRCSAARYAQRFGLIVIIALGESIVAVRGRHSAVSTLVAEALIVAAVLEGRRSPTGLWWASLRRRGHRSRGVTPSASLGATIACAATRTAPTTTCTCRSWPASLLVFPAF